MQDNVSKQTKYVRQCLKDFNDTKKALPKWIIEDLMDESNLYDKEYNAKLFKIIEPNIGINHQADIPDFIDNKKGINIHKKRDKIYYLFIIYLLFIYYFCNFY